MNANYSNIIIFGASKSRSTDFSDLSPALPAPAKSIKNIAGAGDSLSVLREDEESNAGEGSRVKLGRSSSVSSSSVKRALSMRRSSSVSERYCRIHDQPATLSSPTRDDEDGSFRHDGVDDKICEEKTWQRQDPQSL
uniref:Uncharacterized protein n=1 Tax=Salix viminalis TaxID=40686 RepID=A0A6N2K8I1_SALVM